MASNPAFLAPPIATVAASAEVALGTIYRYFPSKDALLAAAMVEWMEDLERRVSARGPSGATTAERVYDVLRRAVSTMERQPELAEAVIRALDGIRVYPPDELEQAFAPRGLTGRSLQVTLHGCCLLALPLLRRLLVKLTTTKLGQNPGLLASALESTQGCIEILVFLKANTRHT
jgi:AcrR family transcriptional regulator